jgi:hypothetical protein
LRVWERLLAYEKKDQFLMMRVPEPADYMAALTSVMLLAGLLWAVLLVCRKYFHSWSFRIVSFLSLAFAPIPLNALRATVAARFSLRYLKSPLLELIGTRAALLLSISLILAVIWLCWKWQRPIANGAVALLMALLPFCGVTFGEALWATAHFRGQPFPSHPLAPRLPGIPAARVVWMIFDEWDYRLTFVDRPQGLAMPATDRLRAESIFAAEAHSPAKDTSDSLPALISGRSSWMAGQGPSDSPAELVEGIDQVRWNQVPTVFSVARRMGLNVGLIGWYLPYCRMVNESVTECQWWPLPEQANSTGETYFQKVLGQTVSLVETNLFSPFGQSRVVRHKIAVNEESLARAEAAVCDPELGLVFLHLPVPHVPNVYNRLTGRMDAKNKTVRGYIDSLALTDRYLEVLRRDMEARGLWDKTAVIATSDHPFRQSKDLDGKIDGRVPFIMKPAGPPVPISYDYPLHTILTSALVISILNGSVSTTPDVLRWLNRHRNDREGAPTSPAAPEDTSGGPDPR